MEEPSLDIEKDVMKQNEQFANQTQMEIEQDSKIHVENLQKKLANGSSFRYLILALCCLYVIGGSMAVDSFGSLSSEMKQKLSLSETEFGTLIASGILPNIAVVFIGGLLVDYLGHGSAGCLFNLIVCFGSLIVCISTSFSGVAIGRFLLGASDSLSIAQTVAITKWMSEGELSMALGISLSTGRLGSFIAFSMLPSLSSSYGTDAALWTVFGCCIASMFLTMACWWLDRSRRFIFNQIATLDVLHHSSLTPNESSINSDKQKEKLNNPSPVSTKEKPKLKKMGGLCGSFFDLVYSAPDRFWYLVAIACCYYGSFMTFSNFSVTIVSSKWNWDRVTAAQLTSLIYVVSMFTSPFVGHLCDKNGKRPQLLMAGNLMLVLTMFVLGTTTLHPAIPICFLALSYSIIPAVLWPCINLVVSNDLVGTANGLCTAAINLVGVILPIFFGLFMDHTGEVTASCLFLMMLGISGFFCSYLLLRADSRSGFVLSSKIGPEDSIISVPINSTSSKSLII